MKLGPQEPGEKGAGDVPGTPTANHASGTMKEPVLGAGSTPVKSPPNKKTKSITPDGITMRRPTTAMQLVPEPEGLVMYASLHSIVDTATYYKI